MPSVRAVLRAAERLVAAARRLADRIFALPLGCSAGPVDGICDDDDLSTSSGTPVFGAPTREDTNEAAPVN